MMNQRSQIFQMAHDVTMSYLTTVAVSHNKASIDPTDPSDYLVIYMNHLEQILSEMDCYINGERTREISYIQNYMGMNGNVSQRRFSND